MTNVDKRLRRAVNRFWATDFKGKKTRAGTRRKQSLGGTDRRNDRVLVKALAKELFDNSILNFPDARIRYNERLRGHFRTENRWDIVLSSRGVGVAITRVALLTKRNFDTEHDRIIGTVIGEASDFWAAYRLGKLGVIRPLLGYFVLLVDGPAVHRSRRVRQHSQRSEHMFETTTFTQILEQSL